MKRTAPGEGFAVKTWLIGNVAQEFPFIEFADSPGALIGEPIQIPVGGQFRAAPGGGEVLPGSLWLAADSCSTGPIYGTGERKLAGGKRTFVSSI